MAQQASSHIIDAVDAAAAAMSQIGSQLGELDDSALDEISERFVSSLSVRTIGMLRPIATTHWSKLPPGPTFRQRTGNSGRRLFGAARLDREMQPLVHPGIDCSCSRSVQSSLSRIFATCSMLLTTAAACIWQNEVIAQR
jgi:hypothetical protein